ncbi:MAG: UDPglucose 6-dehydrogenase [Betaproteobacteria bacterium]|nr:UDPglucose 6-dehydrogenase [Betaproteobacteria bacterium]
MKITIVGAGYVGLVTAAGFAEMGNNVLCVDSDPAKVRMLESGIVPIHEPGLEAFLQSNVKAGRLSFSTSLVEAAAQSELFFIAVGTPPSDDGSPDMSYVYGVAGEIGRLIERYSIVVTKSTVPVGTADRIQSIIKSELDKRGASVEYDAVSNPEFLKEGAAIQDFMQPERIVLGCEGERPLEVLRRLYAPFMRTHERILVMRPREAEMTKYASNALLATKISFMNEIAEFCDELDVDVEKVRAGVGADSRIGHAFLYAGCGYGGSCFPKDIKALIHTAKGIDADAGILKAVEHRNERQKRRLFDKVVARYGSDLKGKTFAMWGLSFKPNTDDVREASSLTMIALLVQAGARVRAYDPIAAENIRKLVSPAWTENRQLNFCDDQYEALEGADALLLVTEWKQFRNPDFDLMKRKLRAAVIFDGRNQYIPRDIVSLGFEYYGIGRGGAARAHAE